MTSGIAWLPLALLIVAGAAAADDRSAEMNALIKASLEEQRVILTCLATLPEDSTLARANWAAMIDDTLSVMKVANIPVATRNAFRAAADPESLIAPDTTPFGSVRAICGQDQDWYRRYTRLDMVYLPSRLREVLNR